MISAAKLAAVETHRRRIWGLCYRMTGDCAAADDLAQDSIARTIERAAQASDATFEGWLYRVATTTCIDWLRRRKVERGAVSLVDPIDLDAEPFAVEPTGEATLLRREDVRLAVLTSLRALAPRQRAVLLLRDVLDRSTEETAAALGLTASNVKVLLHRARAKLQDVHRVRACDAPVDVATVERFAGALEAGDVDALTKLLSDDVWGLVDDGSGRRRPTLGRRAVARQWTNAFARYGSVARVRRARLNGEPCLIVAVADQTLASIHLETRAAYVVSIRVLLDAPRLARLGIRG